MVQWLARGSDACPFCATPLRHVSLSFTLKAIVERLHGTELATRREAMGVEERHQFHKYVAPRLLGAATRARLGGGIPQMRALVGQPWSECLAGTLCGAECCTETVAGVAVQCVTDAAGTPTGCP